MSVIRVVVVDDHPFYREGVKSMVPVVDAGIEVVGEAADSDSALEAVMRLEPDVVLMDLSMPGIGGITVTRILRERVPAVAVLVLTMLQDDSVVAAIEAGARGYLLKDASVEDVCRAIRSVHRGELVVAPQSAPRLVARLRGSSNLEAAFPQLTDREREILERLAARESNADMARAMHLTPKTVRNYVSAVVAKIGAVDREGAADAARAAGASTAARA